MSCNSYTKDIIDALLFALAETETTTSSRSFEAEIRTTSIEMISDRGYTVPDHIKNLQFENYRLLYESKNILQ